MNLLPGLQKKLLKQLNFDPTRLASILGTFSVTTTNARQKQPKERVALAHSLRVNPSCGKSEQQEVAAPAVYTARRQR